MGFQVNGVDVTGVNLDGVPVTEVQLDGVKVWPTSTNTMVSGFNSAQTICGYNAGAGYGDLTPTTINGVSSVVNIFNAQQFSPTLFIVAIFMNSGQPSFVNVEIVETGITYNFTQQSGISGIELTGGVGSPAQELYLYLLGKAQADAPAFSINMNGAD